MQDNHSIYNIYFRIEAGYNGGYMSREQHERFYAEIRRLFTEGKASRNTRSMVSAFVRR